MPSKNNIDNKQNDNKDMIIGRNAVIEALKAGRRVNRLLIADGSRDGSVQKIISLAKEAGVIFETVPRDRIDKLVAGQNHQGTLHQLNMQRLMRLYNLQMTEMSCRLYSCLMRLKTLIISAQSLERPTQLEYTVC